MRKFLFIILMLLSTNIYTEEILVLDRNVITNTRSTFCDHKFLPFPCFDSKYANAPLSTEFFSLLGNSFTIQITSDVDNFISKERGLFSTGNFKADPLKREDLVTLGNFYQKGPEWKRNGELIVWNNGVKISSSKLEFQINGQDSRSAPQKAIRLKLETPLPLSSFAPRLGLSRITIYPLYGSLGGSKIFHYIINEIFRKNEKWFDNWQVTPVMVNDEFWGIYLLARPDLEIQQEYYGTEEGIEGADFSDFLLKRGQSHFNHEALMKFLAFQRVMGNEDIYKNFRTFIDEKTSEINFTYTDLDEVFNVNITVEKLLKSMENKMAEDVYKLNTMRFNEYEQYWKEILKSNNGVEVYSQFKKDNFLYLLFNDLRWGKPFRSNEDLHIINKIKIHSNHVLNQ